ncbi:VOC family protein [Flavivirga amylovorans]|uniref:VOC family protein n=1 Tax=Flavivirga amylovorans TaxID=870486 RepID=A0ABT8WYN7_9FLAO|nr:VOC family protein [Flavivirga amylovorans]MDO5986801.1 VOC family protein [Flavivirga amylovorans]
MKANKLTPNLEVRDIKEVVQFYNTVLGFTLIMAVPDTQDGIEQSIDDGKQYVYALMSKDHVEIMFQRTDTFKKDIVMLKDLTLGASATFYMEIEGLDEFYNEIKNKVSEKTEPKIAWYGMKEFYVKDPSGYVLGFAEKSE